LSFSSFLLVFWGCLVGWGGGGGEGGAFEGGGGGGGGGLRAPQVFTVDGK